MKRFLIEKTTILTTEEDYTLKQMMDFATVGFEELEYCKITYFGEDVIYIQSKDKTIFTRFTDITNSTDFKEEE